MTRSLLKHKETQMDVLAEPKTETKVVKKGDVSSFSSPIQKAKG
jgi:hypothetical protein